MNPKKLPGVESSKASYKQGKATLKYADGAEPDLEAIKAVISNLGYTADKVTIRSAD